MLARRLWGKQHNRISLLPHSPYRIAPAGGRLSVCDEGWIVFLVGLVSEQISALRFEGRR
jgi:hypothetical protein